MDTRSGKRQTIYAGELPELRAKEKEIAKDLDDHIQTDGSAKKMTVNALFDYYMETKELAENTRSNYVKMWNNHVRDGFGNRKVVQLLPSHVKAFYAQLSRAGYSYSTIKLLHTLLYPALELAVDDDIIRKNPAKKALSSDYGTPPEEKEILIADQQEKLFSLICESNVYNVYVPMFIVMLETGLRCGELIGLTWADVDMENRELSINHQLIYKDWGNGYGFRATTPKTRAGIRTIPFTESVYKAMNIKVLQYLMGHAHSDVTMDVYNHIAGRQDVREEVERYALAVGG